MNGIKNCNIALENEVVKNEIPVSITIEKSKNKIKKKLYTKFVKICLRNIDNEINT